MCKELAKSSENAALACLQLGQQMETRGKGLLTLALGSGLQKVMLENLGRTEELARLEQRHAARNQRFTNGANWYNQVKLRHSPTTFQHFVATYRDGGELYAIDAYSKAISSVLAVNPELACAEPVQF